MDGAMGDGPIRIGIVGMGKIARDQHVPALRADSRFALIATASPEGGVDGVPNYPDVEAMLAGPDRLDAVSLCTPPAVRPAIAQAAIAAGVAVMLEKPPASTLAEAQAIVASAQATGVPLFTAWHSREAPAIDSARSWLHGKAVRSVQVTWAEDIRRWHPGQEWILDEGGFGVFDPGINALSIVTDLVKGAWEIDSADLVIPSNRASPISATLALRAGEAAVSVVLDFLRTGPQRWDIAIETDAGRALLADGGATLAIDDGAPFSLPEREYPRLYARFADLVAAGRSDVDLAPLAIVTQAIEQGSRTVGPSFEF